MNRIVRRLAVCSVAFLLAMTANAGVSMALTPPPVTPAGGGVSLQPLHPSSSSPSYFTFRAAAGSTINDAVVITNHATTPVALAISPVDGLTGQTSGSVYANRQDPLAKAGRWVTPSLSALTLPGQSSRTVSFTVKVPADASPGDHLAGIAVENTQPTTSGNGFAIRQILRSVIGVLVQLPGHAAFVPKLTNLGIRQIGQTSIGSVTVGLGNAGLALAKPTLAVSLKAPSGYSRSITRTLDTVLPGDTIDYPFAWPDILQKGSYDITATLTGGGKSVSMSKTVVLGTTLAGVTHPLPKTIVKTQKGSIPVWMLLVVGVAILGILGFGASAVLRRSRRGPPKSQQV